MIGLLVTPAASCRVNSAQKWPSMTPVKVDSSEIASLTLLG